jgi:hypothetical protein
MLWYHFVFSRDWALETWSPLAAGELIVGRAGLAVS